MDGIDLVVSTERQRSYYTCDDEVTIPVMMTICPLSNTSPAVEAMINPILDTDFVKPDVDFIIRHVCTKRRSHHRLGYKLQPLRIQVSLDSPPARPRIESHYARLLLSSAVYTATRQQPGTLE